jgi:hypothetical protein
MNFEFQCECGGQYFQPLFSLDVSCRHDDYRRYISSETEYKHHPNAQPSAFKCGTCGAVYRVASGYDDESGANVLRLERVGSR